MSQLSTAVDHSAGVTNPNESIPIPQSEPTSGRTNLKTRCRLPELMDDPNLDESAHHAALAGLRRVNVLSRSCNILWPEIRRLARENSRRPLRILDIATGGGDVVIGLSQRAMRTNLAVQIDGCDISSCAVEYARSLARSTSPLENNFFQLDALTNSLPDDYDIVMCSLFLHHLSEANAAKLMRRMAQSCQNTMLVSDLRRTRLGYILAWTGCRLLTRSPVVHVDGPLSVRAAWSDLEVRRLAAQADLENITLTRHWPQRFLLSWSRS